jgi:hypothetical protein
LHLHRADASQHIPLRLIAITDHSPPPLCIAFCSVLAQKHLQLRLDRSPDNPLRTLAHQLGSVRPEKLDRKMKQSYRYPWWRISSLLKKGRGKPNSSRMRRLSQFISYTRSERSSGAHVLINNISYQGSVLTNAAATETTNSWNVGITNPLFASLAEGSANFLRLAANSPAIDRGTDVGLPFNGTRPDLGAYETSATAPSPGTLQFVLPNYTVAEGGSVAIGVSRTNGSAGAAAAAYASTDDTALAGSDYPPTSKTLSWAASELTSKGLVITIPEDTEVEGNEQFAVSLTKAQGASLGTPTQTIVTITGNDSAPPVTGTCDGTSTTILGTDGSETLTGTQAADVIGGRNGDDTIITLEGGDIVCGGLGNHTLHGNLGNDRLFGQDGNDSMTGDEGIDNCDGGIGNDTAATCERGTGVP